MTDQGRHSRELRLRIEQTFDLNSLRGLANDLEINFEQLTQGGNAELTTLVVSLIDKAIKQGKLEQLEKLIEEEWIKNTPLDPDETPPYQGLNYFDVDDTDRYFGRDALITSLIQRINDEKLNFLMIVGASGSGKSSLVRAGLIPTLQGNRPQQANTELPNGSKEWPLHLITPSAHPLTELASSLTRDSESVTATTTLIDDLKKDSRSLSLYVRRLLDENKTDQKLLLVVDQFEETFTACQDEKERKAFIENLMMASQPKNGCPILILCTLRADFYHRCLAYESFRAMLETSQANIGPMSRDELEETIEEPATAGQWELDAGLVETILNDIDDEPGALPLLSHALLATWENRKGRTLTVGGYQEAGGVKGAIRNTADKFYNSQKEPENQERIKQIFIRLATLGEGQADTRRRVPLDWLLSIDDKQPEQIQTLLANLVDQRLITTAENRVEISHEALLREWPLLRKWLDNNRDLLRLYHLIASNAREWEENGKDSGYLLAGGQLAQVVANENNLVEFVNLLEQDFIVASKRAERSSILVRWGAAIAAFVSILAIIAAVSFSRLNNQTQTLNDELIEAQTELETSNNNLQEANDAKDVIVTTLEASENELKDSNAQLIEAQATLQVSESDLRESNSQLVSSEATLQASQNELQSLKSSIQASGLVSNAHLQKSINPELALMLSLTAYQLSFQPDTYRGLYDVLIQLIDRTTFEQSSAVKSAFLNKNEDKILATSLDGTATLWDINGNELKEFGVDSNAVNTAIFNPSGTHILTTYQNGTVELWDINRNESNGFGTDFNAVNTAFFNPSGTQILTTYQNGAVKLWGINGEELISFNGHSSKINSAVFSSDGSYVLTASQDGTAKLWNIDGLIITTFDEHSKSVNSADFNLTEERILTASWDGTAKLWDLDGNELVSFEGHGDGVNTAVFSPSGEQILTASWDGTAKLWDLNGNELVSFEGHGDGVNTAVFSPSEDLILTASWDRTAKLWHMDGPEFISLKGHTEAVNSANFDHSGDHVLTYSNDKTVKYWSLKTKSFVTLHDNSPEGLSGIANSQGDRLILENESEDIWIWWTNNLLADAKRNIWRGFEPVECAIYFKNDSLCPESVDDLFSLSKSN